MSKTVTFLVNSTPERPALGYGDYVVVESDEALLFGSHASTCPNPYRLNDHGSAVPWKLIYDWIADGEYQWQCIQHDKYGKCLLINGGGEVASRNPVKNKDGSIFKEVFVHEGGLNPDRPDGKGINPDWRGSIGCCTLHRDYWPEFIACFEIGETGKLIVKPFITGCGETKTLRRSK
jgi:hypothetical protein